MVAYSKSATTLITIGSVASMLNTFRAILLHIHLLGIIHTCTYIHEDSLKEITGCAVLAVYRQELETVLNNMFTRGQACLRVVGHFEYLL
jgi:hypothetical protein